MGNVQQDCPKKDNNGSAKAGQVHGQDGEVEAYDNEEISQVGVSYLTEDSLQDISNKAATKAATEAT